MKFDGVLFDAAETLFTTRGTVGEIYGEISREYGGTASDDEIQAAFIRQFRQSGPLNLASEKSWWKDVVHRVFDDVGMVANFDEFFDKVYDRFRDAQGWRLFPETSDVLDELRTRGLRLGVVSNFDSRIYGVLSSLGIREYFDAITISSETGYAKPDAGIFRAAVTALDSVAARMLMVGDSLMDDAQAAALAGLTPVLIDRRNRYADLNTFTRITDLWGVVPLLSD